MQLISILLVFLPSQLKKYFGGNRIGNKNLISSRVMHLYMKGQARQRCKFSQTN